MEKETGTEKESESNSAECESSVSQTKSENLVKCYKYFSTKKKEKKKENRLKFLSKKPLEPLLPPSLPLLFEACASEPKRAEAIPPSMCAANVVACPKWRQVLFLFCFHFACFLFSFPTPPPSPPSNNNCPAN